MADTVIENLITKLALDVDEGELESFDDFLEFAAKGLATIVAGATAAATAIFFFTKSIAESNDELGKFALRTGVDVEALQELGFVAELNGGSIDSMNSSLENLSRISSEAARGMGPGIEAFGILGISVTDANGQMKDADALLMDVADSISRLGSQAERLEFAQKLGIGGDLLLSIQQGSEAIKKQRQEARELGFIIDKEATVAAADFNDELLRVEKIISGVASAIGTRLMKQIVPMVKAFTDWFKVNKAIIQQNLSAFLNRAIETIKGVFNIVLRVVGIVNSLVAAMGGWENSIIAVTALLLIMNASALLMPILAIASGAAILLILEDIIKFAEGGESAIGELADEFPVLDAALRTMLDLISMAKDGWVLIFTEGDEALEGMLLMAKDAGKAIQDFIIDKINLAIGLINKIPGVDIADIKLKISDINAPDINTPDINAPDIRFGEKRSDINTPDINAPDIRFGEKRSDSSLSFAQPAGNSITNNSTTNKPTVTVNINGGDIDKIKRVISGVLSDEYSGAQTNLESNVEF